MLITQHGAGTHLPRLSSLTQAFHQAILFASQTLFPGRGRSLAGLYSVTRHVCSLASRCGCVHRPRPHPALPPCHLRHGLALGPSCGSQAPPRHCLGLPRGSHHQLQMFGLWLPHSLEPLRQPLKGNLVNMAVASHRLARAQSQEKGIPHAALPLIATWLAVTSSAQDKKTVAAVCSLGCTVSNPLVNRPVMRSPCIITTVLGSRYEFHVLEGETSPCT